MKKGDRAIAGAQILGQSVVELILFCNPLMRSEADCKFLVLIKRKGKISLVEFVSSEFATDVSYYGVPLVHKNNKSQVKTS